MIDLDLKKSIFAIDSALSIPLESKYHLPIDDFIQILDVSPFHHHLERIIEAQDI